jgi:FdhD protein
VGRLTARHPIVRITPDERVSRPDSLAVAEPLELRVAGKALAVPIRTPATT